MKRKNFRRAWLLVVLILFTCTSYAQHEDEINKIASILQDELGKAGVSAERSAIHLSTLSHQELKKYDLDGKSADAFYIKSGNQSVDIKSQSVDGLRNGVYWYLQSLGFRFYFPGETWQHTPQLQSAFKKVEKTVAPSFSHRRIWYAYGTGSETADKDYKKWADANLLGGVEVNAGHSYDGIVKRNRNVFLQHPEYFAQKAEEGKTPPNPKFEPGNEDLVQLLINDAFAQIESRKKKTGQLPGMISMDPSDGGGFSTSASALKIGGPSEQTFYLANRVAKAVRAKYPSIRIGLYAYNLHAAPPKFLLEPNIVVLVATAMNQSAYRTDELIKLWKEKGVEIGIRDYYGVMAWDWDMPGQPRGARFTYIKNLKAYYKTGVRFFSAETNIGWISRGLGHYAGAQLLWDTAADVENIEKEFYTNMFGRSSGEIKKLFQSWQNYSATVPLDGDLYQWSQWLEAATKAENDKKVQQRIDYIKQYLHYVVLFKKWRKKNTDDSLLVQLLNYSYRVQHAGIVASYPLFRRLANTAVAGKKNMRFDDPKAVWKQNNKPLTHEETNQNFYADLNAMNRSEKMAVTKLPRQFKTEPGSTNNAFNDKAKTSLRIRLRGGHKVVFQLQKNGSASINLSTGLIKTNRYKTLRLYIFPYNEELNTSGRTALLSEIIQPSQPLRAISLDDLAAGTYIAVIDDAKNGFTMSFTGAVSYAILAGSQNRIWTFARNNLVFSVGKIKEFKVKNDGVITLVSPTGRIIDLQKQKGLFAIQVQKGEEGIWKMQRQSGIFHLQDVVPFVNPDPDFLLLTKD